MILKVGKTYVDLSIPQMFKVNEIFVGVNEKGKAETIARVSTASFEGSVQETELIVDSKLMSNIQLINV